jgi:hypothetical protein
MVKPGNACVRAILWAALAAFIILAAGSCGRGHSDGRMSSVSSLPSAKSASTPPQGASNNPWDIAAQVAGAQIEAQWRGHNIGDYDLDGTIGVADITPIAMNFGASVEYVSNVPIESGNNEYLACVDGDASGSIGVTDITPIAQHFGESCTGYRVYLGLRATGETEITWNAAFETPPGNPVSLITVPFNESRDVSEVQRYSYSFAKPAGFDGFGKVRVVATDSTNEGALAESDEFPIIGGGGADTAPPYNTGGIPGLSAAAKPGRVILSWGTWEDAQSPPVDIEIVWGSPPLDTNTPEHDIIIDASAQTYEIGSLTNDQAYEFSCRFLDHAAPANATAWLTPVSATPSAHLYSVPPTGAAAISPDAGLSPSVDACGGTATAVHDPYSPMVAYISAGGGDAGQLVFARYNDGAWMTENVSTNTFSSCSIFAAGDTPVIIANEITPSASVVRFWNDAELGGWNSEVIYSGVASNLKTMRNENDAEHPYAVFSTVGASPFVHAAYWDGFTWMDAAEMLGFANSILDISLAVQPGESMMRVLITHGTVDAAQAQIDSTIACFVWEKEGISWFYTGDYALTNDEFGNARSAFSTSFWPGASPNFLGATGGIRIVPTEIPFVGWVDVPYGDLLGMDPSIFVAQPGWVEIMQGNTNVNIGLPLSLTLDWYIEPRWTEGDDTIVFVNVAGTLTFIYDGQDITITGGSLAPTWYTSTRSGSGWSIPQELGAYIPTGRGHDLAPSDTANGFQMVYTQLDTIDVNSLLGGGSVTGGIYYARK